MSATTRPTGIGVVGCGDILAAYMTGLSRFPRRCQVVRLADIDTARAADAAARYGIEHGGSLDELLADDRVEVVINLTPPAAHADVSLACLESRRHVYTEKPLAADTTRAADVLAAAREAGTRIGAAPDTFLGPAQQCARTAIDAGEIGSVIAYAAFCPHTRAERWHPNPGFLFQPGGGPLLDLGPYYVAALTNLFGPVRSVAGVTRVGVAPRRSIRDGAPVDIPVAVATHATAILTHASGVVGTLIASFDIWSNRLPHIEIYGAAGTLSATDPNFFDGEVSVRLHDDVDWRVMPQSLPEVQPGGRRFPLVRGLGVMDLVSAIADGTAHRTSAAFAFHALEVLEAIQTSSDSGLSVPIRSAPPRPEPLGAGVVEGWSA